MPNSEKVQNLKTLIHQYLANGVISANEEATILRSGKEAGLDLETTLRLVGEIEMEQGLGKRNYNLLRMKAYIREYIQNDGVIDENELFTLQEIADKLDISLEQLNNLIDEIKRKFNIINKNNKKTQLSTKVNKLLRQYAFNKWLILILIAIFGIWLTSSPSYLRTKDKDEIIRLFQQIPVKELAVHEFRFYVLTDAFEIEKGNPVIRFTSGGIFGRDIESSILIGGIIDVEYGVDFKIDSNNIQINNNTISIYLPPPKGISARILTEGEFAYKKLASKGKNISSDFENYVLAKIEQDAISWPKEFGLNKLTEDRIKYVLTTLIKRVNPDLNVEINITHNNVELNT